MPGTGEHILEVDTGLTSRTALRGDLDHTIGAVHAPNGGSGSILQHLDVGNILNVHREERGILLFAGIGEVEVLVGVVEDLVVHDNQWVSIAIDGGHTAQTHGRTCTEVT